MSVLHETLDKLHDTIQEAISKGEVDVKATATIKFDAPFQNVEGEIENVPFAAVLSLHIHPREL